MHVRDGQTSVHNPRLVASPMMIAHVLHYHANSLKGTAVINDNTEEKELHHD
jgi:hypothetical protein